MWKPQMHPFARLTGLSPVLSTLQCAGWCSNAPTCLTYTNKHTVICIQAPTYLYVCTHARTHARTRVRTCVYECKELDAPI